MADFDSPNSYPDRWMDEEFIEAFDDFQSLQTLTASLIFRILNTRYELEGRFQADEDLPVMDAFRLRHADEYAVPLSLYTAIDFVSHMLTRDMVTGSSTPSKR